METTYIPHSKINNIAPGTINSYMIWINTVEGTFGTNNSFTSDAIGITGIFVFIP